MARLAWGKETLKRLHERLGIPLAVLLEIDAVPRRRPHKGASYVHCEPPAPWEIETDAGFSLEDLMQGLGRRELAALGWVKPGDGPEHA